MFAVDGQWSGNDPFRAEPGASSPARRPDNNDSQLQLIWARVAQIRTYLEGISQI